MQFVGTFLAMLRGLVWPVYQLASSARFAAPGVCVRKFNTQGAQGALERRPTQSRV